MISAPNFCACAYARPVSSSPEMPVGKPEIVLDSGARSGLAAGRVRFEDEHIEPFGRAVDRGRQARRTGADDHQVAKVRPIDGVVEAKALGDLLVARDCAARRRRGRSAPAHRLALT